MRCLQNFQRLWPYFLICKGVGVSGLRIPQFSAKGKKKKRAKEAFVDRIEVYN